MVKETENDIDVISIIRFNLKPEPIYYWYSEEEGVYKLATIEEVYRIDKEYISRNGEKLVNRKEEEKKLDEQNI